MGIRKNCLIKIENKVFTEENIQKIANIAWEEYVQAKSHCNISNFSVYIKCFDSVSYNSDEISIFENDSQIYNESINSIEIIVSCERALELHIKLFHGYEKIQEKNINNSEIEIGSEDIAKIRNIQGRFQDCLKGIRNQGNIIYSTGNYMMIFIFLVGSVSMGFLLDKLNINSKNYIPFWTKAIESISSFIGSSIAAGFIGGLLPMFLYYIFFVEKSLYLWPTVELQIGNFKFEENRRQYYVLIMTLFILPFAGALVYDIYKFCCF